MESEEQVIRASTVPMTYLKSKEFCNDWGGNLLAPSDKRMEQRIIRQIKRDEEYWVEFDVNKINPLTLPLSFNDFETPVNLFDFFAASLQCPAVKRRTNLLGWGFQSCTDELKFVCERRSNVCDKNMMKKRSLEQAYKENAEKA